MIDYQSHRIAIGCYCQVAKKCPRERRIRKYGSGIDMPSGKVLFFLLYLYYIMCCCLTISLSLLSDDRRPGPLLTEYSSQNPWPFLHATSSYRNELFTHLIGKFFVILIAFVVRKCLINNDQSQIISRLMFISGGYKRAKITRFSRIFSGLYLWYLLLNFLFLTVVNPSLKNPGPINRTKLSVFYCNVQGLIPFGELGNDNPTLNVTKLHELNGYLYENRPDIVVYNETWLKDSIHDNEVLPTEIYKTFRLDRSSYTHPPDTTNSRKFRKNGGRVIIGIKHDIDIESKQIPLKCRGKILSIELTDKTGKKTIISTCYRVGTLGTENHDKIKQYINSIRRRRGVQQLILIGDFNLPSVDWDQGLSPNTTEQLFVDTFNDLSLEQLINVPTHIKGNILDLVLSDKSDNISGLTVRSDGAICGSDHSAITFGLEINAKKKKAVKRRIYNFKHANWDAINLTFNSTNWRELLENCPNVESAWDSFKIKLFDICNTNIPKITISNEFQPPWFDSEVYNLCRKKERLHKDWKDTNSDLKYMKFSRARAEYNKLVNTKMDENFQDNYNRNLINKKFWAYVKAKSNSHRIPEVLSYNDRIRSDPQGQCELFNEYFANQFSGVSNYQVDIDFSNDHLYHIDFQVESIANLLSNINPNKAQGPDGVHGIILKNCASSLAKPLSILFKLSYSSGSIPNEWKLANVVPVHKKGSKAEVTNYRPISLTCLIMKVYERVIRQELLSKCNHMIDSRQHGFMQSKSCCTQLVSFCDSLALSLNDNVRTDVVYFDFQKAFDSASHDIILHKLKYQYNIDGSLLRFFVSYLKDRQQRVVIGSKVSAACPVNSGVPQGSIVGPTLFILFLNDITDGLSPGTDITMYADDTKLWRRINIKDDHWILQRDINHLLNWANRNSMIFHPSKSHVLSIYRGHKIISSTQFVYSMNETPISYTTVEKDLDVLINSKLDWTEHCNAIYSKANQRLGLLKRTCHFTKNISKRRAFYLSQVRSHFEHCTIVWRPSAQTMVEKLESIQKRAVKWILNDNYISFRDDTTYHLACKKLNILPIAYRFDFKDCLFLHSVFHNLNNGITRLPFYLGKFTGNRLRTSHLDDLSLVCQLTPHIPQRLDTTQKRVVGIGKSFFYRAHLIWNKLPYELRAIESASIFKRRLILHIWSEIVNAIIIDTEQDS